MSCEHRVVKVGRGIGSCKECGLDAIDVHEELLERYDILKRQRDTARDEGRREGLEMAAKECDDEARLLAIMLQPTTAARSCARRIRALLPDPPRGEVCTDPDPDSYRCERDDCPVHGTKER